MVKVNARKMGSVLSWKPAQGPQIQSGWAAPGEAQAPWGQAAVVS